MTTTLNNLRPLNTMIDIFTWGNGRQVYPPYDARTPPGNVLQFPCTSFHRIHLGDEERRGGGNSVIYKQISELTQIRSIQRRN